MKDGSTINDLPSVLSSSNPRLKSAVFDEFGPIRDYVVLTKNREILDLPNELGAELEEGDEVAILPSEVGGRIYCQYSFLFYHPNFTHPLAYFILCILTSRSMII